MRRVGPPPGRYPCKQAPLKASPPSRLLRVWQYSRPVETWNKVDLFHIGCRQLWCQIRWKRTCRPLNLMHQATIWTHQDWTGDLYCGIKLKWDYEARTVNLSMPGYIKQLLLKYKHRMRSKPQHCPYAPTPKQYGAKAQAPLPVNISPKLSPGDIKRNTVRHQ